jgi:RimJ/RimL family protein N-acetyltransferase
MDAIPLLETDRLRLRGWRADDLDFVAGFMADPDVMRYLTGEPVSRADAWRGLAGTIGHWALRGYGTWAVERKADSVLVGRVGLINPEGWPGLEVGWTLARPFWGCGYATEAAAAALRYAFLTQPVPKIISCIDPKNKASQAVAKRLGETIERRENLLIGKRVFETDIWSISRQAWQRRNGGP